MKTSAIIKHNQFHPPAVVSMTATEAVVKGRTRDTYEVLRPEARPYQFLCGCKAGRAGLLCRHVQAWVRALLEEKGFDLVQFWNHKHEATRQRRRTIQLRTHNCTFWVTYAKRTGTAASVWQQSCPPIWESKTLYDDGTTRIFATHDGQWKYSANRAYGIYRPQHGSSFQRSGWDNEASFREFKKWFDRVTERNGNGKR